MHLVTRFNRIVSGRDRRLVWLAGLLFGLLVPPTLVAQTNVTRPSNRWLLIVETTRVMQPRAEAIAQSAGNLVLSGMGGQLQPGDTVGVWTFNSDLQSGVFPLQTVRADNMKAIAERVALFVARQKFEGRPGRDKVFPVMNNVISNSEFITVILVTGGSDVISGTPYDKAITAIYKQWQSQQEKARQPFLTMLRAQQGRVTDFEVGMPPGPLAFPPLPLELQAPVRPVEGPVVVKPAAPPPVVPNLIVRGKKPEPDIISNSPPVVVEKTVTPSPALTNATVETRTNLPPAPLATMNAATNFPATNVSAAGVANLPPPAPKVSEGGVNYWIVGTAVLAAVALVFVLARRSRSEPRVSLITRSLDRDQK